MEGDRWLEEKLKNVDWKKQIKNFVIGLVCLILLFSFNIVLSRGDFEKIWSTTVIIFGFTKNNFHKSNAYKIVKNFS